MNALAKRLSLTLGPVLFNWPVDRWVDFYKRVADEAPVDRVCLGEVVCSKRQPFRDDVILETVDRLERGGKEVVYSTLALPTTKREVRAIGEMVEAGYLIEANDISTVQLLDGRPHVIGPFVNIYSEDALAQHLALGATRVCLPPELPLRSIRLIAAGNGAVEVFAFGRAPLALSARCYHARAHGVAKDACQFVCERDIDGMDVLTIDDKPFFAVNGVQTLGHVVTAVTREVAALAEAGVVALRLSPQSCDMVKVAKVFRDLADAHVTPEEANDALSSLPLPGPLSDGFLRGLPGARLLDEVD
ncbi:MAG: U32 family peptidase [Alphaproteobacteria bacterium]|nr:U32 family peptidase [Alphaproteobacteria bacterium]MDE2112050.1 U32 family peptidase [Alphaproteobacteria bacterium]MDE2492434.1 U32 family peptidase [Alphaproteobacteria bacterium]